MNDKQYRWPDLSPVIRQYVVVDDQGRYGIARDGGHQEDTLWARPVGVPESIEKGSVYLTSTSWHKLPAGTYQGTWADYPGTGYIPPEDLRILTIVDDLGYKMPDRWADIALAGSDKMGHWIYGATLGKVGGEPPVKGQKSNEMIVAQAEDYAREVGEKASGRGIRLAAKRGYIPGARKLGRDWLIPYGGFNHYLDHRPKPGRKGKSHA